MRIKKIMKWSVITMAMMAGICLAPQSGKAAEKLDVKIPTERAIYQRDNNNYANVKVSIEYSGTGEVSAKLYDGDKELGPKGKVIHMKEVLQMYLEVAGIH